MSADTDAANLVAEYERVINYACAKAWHKWRAYVESAGHHAAFTREDIRQVATEGFLLLAGMLPGRAGGNKLSGSLGRLEAEGGERYIQHAIDLFVSSALLKEVEKARADFRGGGLAPPESLDAVPAGFDGAERAEHYGAVETSPVALSGIRALFPLLSALKLDGYPHETAADLAGLTAAEFAKALKREVAGFAEWARASGRVAAGATPRRNALAPCPHGEPSCSGVHSTSHGRAADLCIAVRDIRDKSRSRARDAQRASARAA